MASNVITLLFLLCSSFLISFNNVKCVSANVDEDLELEKQLKVLNKPSTKLMALFANSWWIGSSHHIFFFSEEFEGADMIEELGSSYIYGQWHFDCNQRPRECEIATLLSGCICLIRALRIRPREVGLSKTEDGNIFDCVDITNQPALDHPLLKDHEIQTKPSSYTAEISEEFSTDDNVTLQYLFDTFEECPIGTVPIQRTSKEHLIRARSLLDDRKRPDPKRQAVVSLMMKPSFRVFGAGGRVSVQNLRLSTDQFSSSNIWIQGGPSRALNYIVAGWMVSPKLYGDSRTRLSTFWTGDGNRKTGCYNTLCSGFVQVDRRITPTTLVVPASKYGGSQYDIKVQIYQDRRTGNWWFLVSDGKKNVQIGYWPKKLFPYLKVGTKQVAWGGITQAGKTGTYPPMGNGRFPDGNYRHACYFANVHYVNNKNKMVALGSTTTNRFLFRQNDKPKCYGLKNGGLTNQNLGYSFTFGGPGGKCR